MSSMPERSHEFEAIGTTGPYSTGDRTHPRRQALRLVEYSDFPRMDLDAGRQTGLALNESDSGLCIAVSGKQEIGSLLRVTVRGIDGRSARDVVARVVWCRDADEGRFRIGLEMLRENKPRMMRVRLEGGQRKISIGE
jgi:hypothetical protein